MAYDHFEKHKHHNLVDWNFNLVYNSQPAIVDFAKHYESALQHPGLYDPIPAKWLHATILRVGTIDEYTEEEMLAVAKVLQPKLATLELPVFQFDAWWLWSGNVVFHISPGDHFTKLYTAVESALKDIVGEARTPKTPHGQFVPHTSLAYTRAHDDEQSLHKQLLSIPLKSAAFAATHMPLIKQWPVNGHYEWEVIKDLYIGKS
jgi:2'-5' RNA ligase